MPMETYEQNKRSETREMLIPRSGYSGMALKLLDKQYNTLSDNHHLYADKVFDVPFIGQNHTNLCADAAAFMVARWARHVLPGVNNLKYETEGYANLREFFKDVASFKGKSRDKLRDEAVRIFDKYLNPDPAVVSSKKIIQVFRIDLSSELFSDLNGQIESCRQMKLARDREFGGILNRWTRHKTKQSGYVVDHTVFDPLIEAIQKAFFSSGTVAEFIRNPRATPVSGLTCDEIAQQYESLLDAHDVYDPTSFKEWTEFMDKHGPVVVMRQRYIKGIGYVGHCLVVNGYVRSSQYLIYHDPWKGPDKRVIYMELYDNMADSIFTIKDQLNPLMQGLPR